MFGAPKVSDVTGVSVICVSDWLYKGLYADYGLCYDEHAKEKKKHTSLVYLMMMVYCMGLMNDMH